MKNKEPAGLDYVSKYFGYYPETMYRYLQRAEFRKYIIVLEPRTRFLVEFSPEFKKDMMEFLKGLRGKARWKKPKTVRSMDLNGDYSITTIEDDKEITVYLLYKDKKIRRMTQQK